MGVKFSSSMTRPSKVFRFFFLEETYWNSDTSDHHDSFITHYVLIYNTAKRNKEELHEK